MRLAIGKKELVGHDQASQHNGTTHRTVELRHRPKKARKESPGLVSCPGHVVQKSWSCNQRYPKP